MNSTPEKTRRIKEIHTKLIEMFKTGNVPALIAGTIIEKKRGDKPSCSWSLGNKILMYCHGTNDARGYKQWQKVSRQVKKGASAFSILAPVLVIKETGEFDENDKPVKRQVLVGFKPIPVFRYEDTEGKDLPKCDYKPANLPPLFGIAKKLNVQVTWKPFDGTSYGKCTIDGKKITLMSHNIRTFFHELGHAAHAKFYKLEPGQDPNQEVVAEMVAATLCVLYSQEEWLGNSWDYIKMANGYDSVKAIKTVFQVLSDVEKCLDIILESANEKKIA